MNRVPADRDASPPVHTSNSDDPARGAIEGALVEIEHAVTAIVDNLERVDTPARLWAARRVLDARKSLDRTGFRLIRACVQETSRGLSAYQHESADARDRSRAPSAVRFPSRGSTWPR